MIDSSAISIDVSLDAKGLRCPIPLIKAKQALKKLEAGQVLEVFSTDPSAKGDFDAMLKHLPDQLLAHERNDKQDHFLYLTSKLDDAADAEFPAALLDLLGELEFVLEFDLTPERKLPNADTQAVLDQLEESGYFLQMPRDSMWQVEEQMFS